MQTYKHLLEERRDVCSDNRRAALLVDFAAAQYLNVMNADLRICRRRQEFVTSFVIRDSLGDDIDESLMQLWLQLGVGSWPVAQGTFVEVAIREGRDRSVLPDVLVESIEGSEEVDIPYGAALSNGHMGTVLRRVYMAAVCPCVYGTDCTQPCPSLKC